MSGTEDLPRAAYRTLPPTLREIVDTHSALHAGLAPPNASLADFPGFDAYTAQRRPLVIRHPRSRLYLPKNPASKIEGMSDKQGRNTLEALWNHVSACEVRYESRIPHNNLVVWDGLGTVHSNPAYPRDQDLTTWFLIVPGKTREVERHVA